jgi:uncharacterized protein
MMNLLKNFLRRVKFYLFKIIKRNPSEKLFQRSIEITFPAQTHTLASIDLNHLKLFGIQGIILDLDNTIISEDDQYLSPHAEDWIAKAKELDLKLFFLSNGKRGYRVEYWSSRLDVPAIHPAKKPFPPSFRKAIKHMRLSAENVVVIGDSRHTDILGAWLVGCRSIQVASLPHPKRWWEKVCGKLVQTPYPKVLTLWDFSE